MERPAISEQSALADAITAFRRRLERYDWSGQTPSRRQILEVFLRLAIQRGFTTVSMRMIAQEIGIKAPSIYAHFPGGRDEIVADSMRWHFHEFGMAVLDEIADCAMPDDVWTTIVRVHLTRQLQFPQNDLWDLMIATDRLVDVLPPAVSAEAQDLVEHYEALFRTAVDEAGFEAADDAVRIVMTLLEGAGRWCRPGDDFRDLAVMTDRTEALCRMVLQLAGGWTDPGQPAV